MRKTFMNRVVSFFLPIMLLISVLGGVAVLFGCNINNSDDTPTAVDFSKLSYAAFGDSITYGWDTSIMARMDRPYPTCVADILGLEAFSNNAVSGSTITQIEGLTNVNSQVKKASTDYDIVSVMIGVNDFARSATLGAVTDTGLSTVYGGLNTLIGNLKVKYPDAFIFFITPLPCYSEEVNSNAVSVSLEEVVSAIKQVCGNNNIPVLDMHKSGEFTMLNDPYGDGLHPTQAYMTNYAAPKIATFIKENYK